jgi:20S proteasome alpha/beta subunit
MVGCRACERLLLVIVASSLAFACGVKLRGGSALALAGDGCVALAMDQRVGTR